MSKKQNTAEKYLTTARTSLIDYIFAVLIGIGVVLVVAITNTFQKEKKA